ncbi:alpha/beta hydrolase [Spirosoma sp.]|uniref:alpha/beta hydrolase n=1 Tax=Spirosoma sp. TaxID=1899569 RepID=UPI002605DD50|nr:alpha/beta hydrolase [Spirosoma sp.]MCX6215316.1 alpha/beta hydrolase [Spirosoma sp.]
MPSPFKQLVVCLVFLGLPSSLMAQRYVFFLHNRFLEEHELSALEPTYGRAEYREIITAFQQAGFEVISEKRPANTNIDQYAHKVSQQIDSLLRKGVQPNHITIIGTSKGGYIAQYVSTLAANPALNFIFIGCFRESDITNMPMINFCGNILTIYERSDSFGVSAIQRKKTSKLPITRFEEIELNTNQKHGFLFHALPEWIKPSIQWAKGQYAKAVPGNP